MSNPRPTSGPDRTGELVQAHNATVRAVKDLQAERDRLLDNTDKQNKVIAGLHEKLEAQSKSLGEIKDRMAKTIMPGHPDPNSFLPGHAPNVRNGENIMGSRGFSLIKMLGVVSGQLPPEQAKIEMDVHDRLHKGYTGDVSAGIYEYGCRGGIPGMQKMLAPLSTAYMHDQFVSADFRREMKSLMHAGAEGADFDEMRWIKLQQLVNQGVPRYKALSWLKEDLGGALVAPPEMGELIELLRNKEALVNAGARVVPLPPQGRMQYPRQTAASLTYWVGESAPITESDIKVGTVTLQAKKLAVLIKAPNELIRFASPAAEALMRDDMTKSLALGLDLAGLEGLGGDNRPRGVIHTPGINLLTSSSPGANGDALVGQDIYRFVAIVEENNAEFESFVMRPKTLYKYYQLRSDAVGQGDASGPFLFNLIREAGEGVAVPMLGGYPVTKSTQVSGVRGKGSATDLTYILGGAMSNILIGMFGAIEFAATTLGDTPFVNDQTWVRGILSADIAVRIPASLVWMDNLIVNPVS